MAYAPIALTMPQYEDYANWYLKAYTQGTTTPLSMATNSGGGTTLAKSEIDANGFPTTDGSARFIPYINGAYDLWMFPTSAEADANDTTNAIQLADNINADPASAITVTTVSYADNVSALIAIDGTVESRVSVSGYHSAGDGGGGEFYWDASQDKANHNGGTIIDPDIVFPTTWATKSERVTWYTAGTGTGCWVRKFDQYEAKHFGAKGDGTAVDYEALNAAITAIPNRVRPLPSSGAWEHSGSYTLHFASSSTTYKYDTKLVVPAEKNIVFACDEPAGAVLEYTGGSYYGIEFTPGSVAKSIGVRNLGIKTGGVVVIGTNGGSIVFDQPYFFDSKDYALTFVDGPDYTDGPTGDYTSPSSYSAASSGVNTVFVYLHKPQFHYCNKGLNIQATTVLLFNAFKPRFNATTNTPLTINAVGVIIEEPELQGIENYTTSPYIHFPMSSVVAHVFIKGGRCGSETFTEATLGRTFRPAENSIVFGEVGAYSAPAESANNIRIENMIFEGDNSGANTTQHLVRLNGNVKRCIIEQCVVTNYQDAIIDEVAFVAAAQEATDCEIIRLEKGPSNGGDYFSNDGAGWIRDGERLEVLDGTAPTTTAFTANAGTGATCVIATGGNDLRGKVTLTTGTGATATATIPFQIDYNRKFNVTPTVVLMPQEANAAGLTNVFIASSTTSLFTVNVTGLADATAYSWTYHVIG